MCSPPLIAFPPVQTWTSYLHSNLLYIYQPVLVFLPLLHLKPQWWPHAARSGSLLALPLPASFSYFFVFSFSAALLFCFPWPDAIALDHLPHFLSPLFPFCGSPLSSPPDVDATIPDVLFHFWSQARFTLCCHCSKEPFVPFFFCLFARFFELSVFPGGCDWSVCVLFKEACKKAGLFTVPSKYRLSRDRKYHRPEAQQHTASANMQPLPPPPPPPPHGWTEAPAKQPSRLSENYAPLPSAAHSPEWRTYAAGFSPHHHVLSRVLPFSCAYSHPSFPLTASLRQYSMPE